MQSFYIAIMLIYSYHHGIAACMGIIQISVKSTAFYPYFGRKINGE